MRLLPTSLLLNTERIIAWLHLHYLCYIDYSQMQQTLLHTSYPILYNYRSPLRFSDRHNTTGCVLEDWLNESWKLSVSPICYQYIAKHLCSSERMEKGIISHINKQEDYNGYYNNHHSHNISNISHSRLCVFNTSKQKWKETTRAFHTRILQSFWRRV